MTIALIDGDIGVYRIGFSTEDVEARFAFARMREMIEGITEAVGADSYELYLSPSQTFRHRLATRAPYKGNRKDQRKPVHYEALRDYMVLNLRAVIASDEEADDRLGVRGTELGDEGVICTIDKDLDQVPGLHYNFVQHRLYTVTPEKAEFYFYRQLLTGDRVDNILGPGLTSGAEKLLKRANVPYKHLKGLGVETANKLLDRYGGTVYDKWGLALKCYNGDREWAVENGNLLYIRRHGDEPWEPPA